MNTAPPTTDVHVLYNGTSTFDGSINGYNGKGQTPSDDPRTQMYSTSRFLAAGDTLDFAVEYGANMTYFSDTTGLKATVATPEPETWAMMALGVGALALMGWKRKRSASPEAELAPMAI